MQMRTKSSLVQITCRCVFLYFRQERLCYYNHRLKSKGQDKDNYLCIIIDGMDQAKLLVANLLNIAKAYCSAWRLRTHLTGVLNHGREVLAFIDLFQWPHGSNLTINVLLRTLVRLQHVPDVLYLQMDNCYRENKNQFVFVFLAVLILKGVFTKVHI